MTHTEITVPSNLQKTFPFRTFSRKTFKLMVFDKRLPIAKNKPLLFLFETC